MGYCTVLLFRLSVIQALLIDSCRITFILSENLLIAHKWCAGSAARKLEWSYPGHVWFRGSAEENISAAHPLIENLLIASSGAQRESEWSQPAVYLVRLEGISARSQCTFNCYK